MQQGPTEQQDSRGIAYLGFRQILSVTLRTTASPRSMAITAAPWSTLSEGTNLEFRGEFFNLLNHPNFLFAKSGLQSDNNSTILGTPQFGFETAALDPRQIQLAFKFSF
jgi:hypothetical protein